MSVRKNLYFILWSIASSLALLFLCYVTDNWRMSLLTGPSVGQRIEQAREYSVAKLEQFKDSTQNQKLKDFYSSVIDKIKIDETEYLEDFVFINTAYDRELVPVYDDFFEIGQIDVTNRRDLNELLIKMGDAPRYILFDVLISDKYESPNDSALIETLLITPNIAIARTERFNLKDNRLLVKSAYTDYVTNILESNFIKYEFLKNDSNTMASKAYREIIKKDQVVNYGPFYYRDGHLQWKSISLRFPIKLWNPYVEGDEFMEGMISQDQILNLAQVVNFGNVENLVKDKIVVIGDFTENDMHTTYMGKIAGPVINVNALEALLNNEQEIPWWLVMTLFLLYFIVSFSLIKRYKLINIMKLLRLNNPVLQELASLIGFTAFFAFVAGIIYLSSGKEVNVIIPSLWFTLLRGAINWKRWKIKKQLS